MGSEYRWPAPDVLLGACEEDYRDLGLGYRAKYLSELPHAVLERGGEAWLHSLREKPSQAVHEQLIQFKVRAECVY
jgi:3-methyladenine DNA glycosylase/8-oxoguanine DNA glycosylase